jgi:hypothetical protein
VWFFKRCFLGAQVHDCEIYFSFFPRRTTAPYPKNTIIYVVLHICDFLVLDLFSYLLDQFLATWVQIML